MRQFKDETLKVGEQLYKALANEIASLVPRPWLLTLANSLVTQVQKFVSTTYIPGGFNEIAGFVMITPKNAIVV